MVRNNLINQVPQMYSIASMEHPRLIVGLGNPGNEYANNRHNIGFMVLDKIAESHDVSFVTKKDLRASVAVAHLNGKQIIFAKPLTYMNLSGESLHALTGFYNVNLNDIIVVHDELDLPFGKIQLKNGGGSAGHNGLKSIIKLLGENFSRIRLGIGSKTPDQIDTADFVLQNFSKEEVSKLPHLINQAVEEINKTI